MTSKKSCGKLTKVLKYTPQSEACDSGCADIDEFRRISPHNEFDLRVGCSQKQRWKRKVTCEDWEFVHFIS